MAELNTQDERTADALAGNLHEIFFHRPLMTDDDRAHAARNVIQIAANQLGAEKLAIAFSWMHEALREKVKALTA